MRNLVLDVRPMAAVVFCGVVGFAWSGEARQAATGRVSDAAVDLPFAISGPPPPAPPAVIARDQAGHVTVRAVRLDAPLKFDGQLDEVIYKNVPSMTDFIQAEPHEGDPETQKTEVWLFFDGDNIYVSARCWATHPIVATEMRHDNSVIFNGNDNLGFIFDTFYDRRNGVFFSTNAIGGRAEGQSVNERQYIPEWNGVWDSRVARFDGGWTVESVVPFKTLRYRPGRAQVWGFNVARKTYGSTHEHTYLSAVPAARGSGGILSVSLGATLVGLEVPPGSKNLEIKPYATTNLTSDRTVTPRISNDIGGDVGLDIKYGITQNLTTDFTYNTDFAQVEVDEQQINLTRFSLFFPEKREFFLENQGTFGFGGAGTSQTTASSSDTPILFYTRRIGLNQGRAVPISVGGRLTGRVGRYSLGVLNIRADDEPASGARATTFSVLRVKRDVLRKSSVGVMFTGRSVSQSGAGSNQAFGVDGTFAFFDNLAINTYWAQTRTRGLHGDDTSYRAQLDYVGDRYGVQLEHLGIGDNFNPEAGFVRRDNMRRSFAQFRFSPRPRSIRSVRKVSWMSSAAYVENGAGRVETREFLGEFSVDFQNTDRFLVGYTNTYEFLLRPFGVGPGVTLPVGGYQFAKGRIGFTLGQHRTLAGNALLERGTFYNGHNTALSLTRGRLKITPQLSMEPTFSVNWVDLVEGSFVSKLPGSRVTYTMAPTMFVSALLQYNSTSNSVAANVRLRWEYRPGSELFVVYNEQRDTLARAFPDLTNRAFVIKVNRLLRF